jgi:hypothetical protein
MPMAVPPWRDAAVCRRGVQRLAALTGRRCTGRDPARSRTTPSRRSSADRKDRAAQAHRRRAPWNPSTPGSGPQRPRSNAPPPCQVRHRTPTLPSMLALRWSGRRSRRMRRLGDRYPLPRHRRARRSPNLAMRLTTRRLVSPGRRSYPCATGRRPVGPSPRSGQVEMRLGPAWVRYRETATPETDPPSASHRPVLILGRHRAHSSRLRVTLPRCRPCPWCQPAAMPTSPTYPARVRLRLRGPQVAAAAVPARRGACSGIRRGGPPAPAVLHRVAE